MKHKMDSVLATLSDKGLRPKVVHNREARVTAAFAVRELTSLGYGTLEVTVGIFACCAKDVWIRSRGYQGAMKRLVRKPETFTVLNIKDGEREEVIDDIFRYFVGLTKTRQVGKLFQDLVAYVGNGRTVAVADALGSCWD